MKIERKIAIGYTIIVALIGGIVYTPARMAANEQIGA